MTKIEVSVLYIKKNIFIISLEFIDHKTITKKANKTKAKEISVTAVRRDI